MSVQFFTAAFGIAPIRKMPSGVKIARIGLRDGPEVAWSRFRAAHPTVVKPYWTIYGQALVVVTEADCDKVKTAMRETFPKGRSDMADTE